MKEKISIILSFILIVILITVLIIISYLLYSLNYAPSKKYTNKDFHIKTYISEVDKDGDGIDDQTDILNSVKKYIATNPKYKSRYYVGRIS